MTGERSDDVVAHVLLRTAGGERPGERVPITAATLDELRPPAGAQDDVARYFIAQGFAVDVPAPVLVTIRGSAAQLDAHFGVELVAGPDGGLIVRRPTGEDRSELPLTQLPSTIQELVAAISLEVPMTLGDDELMP